MSENTQRSIVFILFIDLIAAAVLPSRASRPKTASDITYPYIYKKGDCDYILVGEGGLINASIKSNQNVIRYGNQTYAIKFDAHKCDIVDASGLEIHNKLYY